MNSQWTTKHVDKFVIVNQMLGSGTYGTVYRGFELNNDKNQVAVKTIPIRVISGTPRMLEFLKREISIMKKVKHQNIVELRAVSRSDNNLYMFLEYCEDGDLQQFMARHEEKRMSEIESVIFMKHIVEGFRVLYEQKIIHRDIKPANILLHRGKAKITDFGFARVITNEMNGEKEPALMSRLGSPLYMAPQILQGQPFSAKCDIWSLGVMFYEMLYGVTPWNGDGAFAVLKCIEKQVHCPIPLSFPIKPVRSQQVKSLISRMLVREEKQRISWDEVFENSIIKINESRIVENMERINANKDNIWRSMSLNKLYIEQNLVIGYLEPLKVNKKLGQIKQQQDEQMDEEIQITYNQDINEQEIINKYSQEKKKRDINKKFLNYFLYERNITFFFNFVFQYIIQMYNQEQIPINQESYRKLIFLLLKNQLMHLEKINKQVTQNNIPPVKMEINQWGFFLVSDELKKLQDIIQQDRDQIWGIFDQIYQSTKSYINSKGNDGIDFKFNQILNNIFDNSTIFHEVYRKCIVEVIRVLRVYGQQTKDILLCISYLHVCLNPYDNFTEINFDFNKFYEDNENKTFEETQQVLKLVINI